MSKLEKLALWWIRNYEDCTQFWPGFVCSLAICAFIVGAFKGWPIGQVLIGISCGAIILNTGLICLIRTLKYVLKNLPEGPEKEEAHDLMVGIINRRLGKKEYNR